MSDESGDLWLAIKQGNEQNKQLLEATLEALKVMSKTGGFNNQSSITQNTGSVPVWIAMTLCFGLFTATLTMVSVTTHHNDEARAQIRKDIDKLDSKVSRLQDYVNVLYKQPTAKEKQP